jgi:hypothetical protein
MTNYEALNNNHLVGNKCRDEYFIADMRDVTQRTFFSFTKVRTVVATFFVRVVIHREVTGIFFIRDRMGNVRVVLMKRLVDHFKFHVSSNIDQHQQSGSK